MENLNPSIQGKVIGTTFKGQEIVINEYNDEKFGKSAQLKNLQISDFKFLPEGQFSISDQCFLCSIPFEKSQNCNLCGKQCCLPCIRKSINQKNVCDFCFLKTVRRTHSKKQKEIKSAKQQQAQELKLKTQELQTNITEEESQIITEDNNEDSEQQFEKLLQDKDNELEQLQREHDDKKEQSEQKLIQLDQLSKQLELEFNTMTQIQAQYTTIDTDYAQNSDTYEIREQKLLALQKQQKKILNSKSYVTFQHDSEKIEEEDLECSMYSENPQSELLNKNNNNHLNTPNTRKVGGQYGQDSMNAQYPDKLSTMERDKSMNQQENCCCNIF